MTGTTPPFADTVTKLHTDIRHFAKHLTIAPEPRAEIQQPADMWNYGVWQAIIDDVHLPSSMRRDAAANLLQLAEERLFDALNVATQAERDEAIRPHIAEIAAAKHGARGTVELWHVWANVLEALDDTANYDRING